MTMMINEHNDISLVLKVLNLVSRAIENKELFGFWETLAGIVKYQSSLRPVFSWGWFYFRTVLKRKRFASWFQAYAKKYFIIYLLNKSDRFVRWSVISGKNIPLIINIAQSPWVSINYSFRRYFTLIFGKCSTICLLLQQIHSARYPHFLGVLYLPLIFT